MKKICHVFGPICGDFRGYAELVKTADKAQSKYRIMNRYVRPTRRPIWWVVPASGETTVPVAPQQFDGHSCNFRIGDETTMWGA